MEIPNYDCGEGGQAGFKQLYPFMPNAPFRMLIAAPSGGGKTNILTHMLRAPLLHYDQIFLYARNLEQEKYQQLANLFDRLSAKVGYPILACSNDIDDILPLEALNSESQKIVVFDDFVTEANQKPIIDYFIGGRHKNCSPIYLSQSFFNTPKSVRLNCSHFCIGDFPTKREQQTIASELGVSSEQYKKATNKPFDFLWVDKPKKKIARNFYGSV